MTRIGRRGLASWVFLGGMLLLCGVLGFLQYRWIGAVSRAERERLRASLQESLEQLSEDFNLEIVTECGAIMPQGSSPMRPKRKQPSPIGMGSGEERRIVRCLPAYSGRPTARRDGSAARSRHRRGPVPGRGLARIVESASGAHDSPCSRRSSGRDGMDPAHRSATKGSRSNCLSGERLLRPALCLVRLSEERLSDSSWIWTNPTFRR